MHSVLFIIIVCMIVWVIKRWKQYLLCVCYATVLNNYTYQSSVRIKHDEIYCFFHRHNYSSIGTVDNLLLNIISTYEVRIKKKIRYSLLSTPLGALFSLSSLSVFIIFPSLKLIVLIEMDGIEAKQMKLSVLTHYKSELYAYRAQN